MENWKLQNVDNIEFTRDKSGIYVLINWENQKNSVRLDIMSDNDEPIQSFSGKAENVRKAVMRFLSDEKSSVSLEHAAYIGSEIEKCDIMRIDYIQDKPAKRLLSDAEIIEKYARENKENAESILQNYCLDNNVVCKKCGYSKCGFSSDNILMCLDCGSVWNMSDNNKSKYPEYLTIDDNKAFHCKPSDNKNNCPSHIVNPDTGEILGYNQ